MSKKENKEGKAVSADNSDIAEPEMSPEALPEEVETDAEAGKIEQLEEKISELESENSDLKNQYLRKQADFENFRKRMFREKEDAIKYANSTLLEDLITIIDDFERAIVSGSSAQDIESFRTGIEMIEKQFVGILERKYGLKRFDSDGEEFDPERHEAIGMEESTEHAVSMVLEDYQKGYMLHDRVLRHAKVKVSMPVTGPDESGQTDDDQDNKNELTEGEE